MRVRDFSPRTLPHRSPVSLALLSCFDGLSDLKRLEDMRRRDFIKVIGGAAATWPLAGRAQQGKAQQGERVRRIGVLMASAADDSEHQARLAGLLQGLTQLGSTEGRNLRIGTRWATTDADELRRHAAELAALAPGVLVAASGTSTTAANGRFYCKTGPSESKTARLSFPPGDPAKAVWRQRVDLSPAVSSATLSRSVFL